MIKIMIVDDQKIFREGLKMILSQDSEVEVVALCENGQEAIDSIGLYDIDVILMDIKMKIMNGVDAVKHIKKINEKIEIIMLTTFYDDEFIYDAIKNGASGYLLKDTSIKIITSAIKTVYSGATLMDPEVMKVLINQFTKLNNNINFEKNILLNTLTNREVEISKLISEGMNNKEISKKLFLGEGTIKNHLTRILQKLELRDRTQLAIFILKNIK